MFAVFLLHALAAQQVSACRCPKDSESIESSYESAAWVVLAQAGEFTPNEKDRKIALSVINSWKGDLHSGDTFEFANAARLNVACEYSVYPKEQHLLFLHPTMLEGKLSAEKKAFICSGNILVKSDLPDVLADELDLLSETHTNVSGFWTWFKRLFR